MIEKVTNKEFINSEYEGHFAPIEFDTYLELPGGKEEIQPIQARVHYYEFGEGEPLIMLHGMGQSLYTYRSIYSDLSKEYRVIIPDLIGHGYSDCPDMLYTVQESALAIEAFMDYLQIPKASFIAFEQSCAYVLDLAMYGNNRVDKIVLISPGAFSHGQYSSMRMISSGFGSMAINKFCKPNNIAKFLEASFFDKTMVNDSLIEGYSTPLANPDVRTCMRRSIVNFDDSELLSVARSLNNNVLVLWSVDDPIFLPEDMHSYIKSLSKVYTCELRNCGHFPHEEKPKIVTKSILEFFQK